MNDNALTVTTLDNSDIISIGDAALTLTNNHNDIPAATYNNLSISGAGLT